MHSPFFDVPESEWVASNRLAFAIRDRFPVSPGHTLVVPRRQVVDWWSASADEHVALLALIDAVKSRLDIEFHPDGYNVGFNAGAAAGQTIFHLHVHVIPRYQGDTHDPRGGVRHVIPGLGNYLARPPRLVDGPTRPLAEALVDVVTAHGNIDRADLVVSFVMVSGLRVLQPVFDQILDREGQIRIIATDYLGVTEQAALGQLLRRVADTTGRFRAKLFRAGPTSFHPKGYLFSSATDGQIAFAFVGSANASRSGLVEGAEWTLETGDSATVTEARRRFDALWDDPRCETLTESIVAAYREAPRASELPPLSEPPTQPIAPTPIQEDALRALEQSRLDGFGAGLVVMATGLGKTWLAAFDCTRPLFRRVLFVAHREEILTQARAVYRQVHPDASIGMVLGVRHEDDADIVFASVQTLARRVSRLDPRAFDYVIIDEFHHAAAASYRAVLAHLEPQFLLGITATPDRTDGADLLALCEDNLVFERGLGAAIDAGALVPFHYAGIPDPVDFSPLPWRNAHFDPDALENAVISQDRAEAAYREWMARRGARTLAFCVSRRHADWMAAHFQSQGARAAAVHGGANSMSRAEALAQLRSGELDIVMSVDLFNEGLDIPEIDTVLMLRPTTSSVLFLQQLGRGLRISAAKSRLTVIDFVGNHRSFLLPVRWLASLARPDAPLLSDSALRQAVQQDAFSLPVGCEVDYSLEAKGTILALLSAHRGRALASFIEQWSTERGRRPDAVEAYRAGRNPATAEGTWFGMLRTAGFLNKDEARVFDLHQRLFVDVARTAMTKSYKMIAIRALLMSPDLGAGMTIEQNASIAKRIILRDPRLLDDIHTEQISDLATIPDRRWVAFWRQWPLEHLAGRAGFALRDDRLLLATDPAEPDLAVLSAMLSELVDWRLAAYLDRPVRGRILMRVSHAGERPMLWLDRKRYPNAPSGREITVIADGREYLVDFMKVAVNVAKDRDGTRNVLPDLMWQWFGPDAGSPGTNFEVELWTEGDAWHLGPSGQQTDSAHTA